MADETSNGRTSVRTQIPARLDRLLFSRFHVLIVAALGVTWILDGLEVTLVGSIGPALQDRHTLGLTAAEIGSAASAYLFGGVFGALFFGWITDRVGRRMVFFLTLGIYLAGVLMSAAAWDFWSFALFRLVTGIAIGGEYAAINSAVDELIPARHRGRVDILVNGSFWIGASLGAGGSLLLLNPLVVPVGVGWRLGFAIGGILGLFILALRRFVPESPRWLVTHCRTEDAERVMEEIERRAAGEGLSQTPLATLEVHPRRAFPLSLIFRTMIGPERAKSVLALILMASQAFLFNAVFFTYGVSLTRFRHVAATRIGLYLLPLTCASFLGPLLLAPLFDTLGRRRMIVATFLLSGALLMLVALLFGAGALDARSETLAWAVIFFFASAAASSAYLTVSEIFPLETRPLAIACFYALGTLIGGVLSPLLFGALIEARSPWALAGGYGAAALLMIVAGGAEAVLGIDAEGRSLESLSTPLSGSGAPAAARPA